MNRTIKVALGLVLGGMILGGLPTQANAQDDILSQIIPSLEFQEADVREALRSLFKSKNVSYSIDPKVQGVVNVSLKNVTFEAALQNITRQVEATYRIEGGVFNVFPKPIDTGTAIPTGLDSLPTTTNKKPFRRIWVKHADPQFIAMMIGQAAGSQNYTLYPERTTIDNSGGGGMGGGMGGMGGGMGGMGGGMSGGMGGMGGGMSGGMGGMSGGMGGRSGGGFGGGGGMGGRGGF